MTGVRRVDVDASGRDLADAGSELLGNCRVKGGAGEVVRQRTFLKPWSAEAMLDLR